MRVSRKFVAFSAILALAIVAAGSVIALSGIHRGHFLQSLFWAVLFAVLEPLILLVHSRIWLKIACREMIYLQWVRLQPAQEAVASSWPVCRMLLGGDSQWALVATLLLAFALRVWGLDDRNIWWDEGLATWAARLPVAAILNWTAHDVHPPLYFLLQRACLVAAGGRW